MSACCLALSLGAATPADAGIAASAGFDRFEASDGQWTRALVGVAAVPIGRGDLVAGVTRFETPAGAGGAWILGGGVPLAGAVQMRAIGTFVGGPDDRRARRFQAGPRLAASGSSIALSYTHDEEPGAPSIAGALAEASIRVERTLFARAALGYAVAASGDRGARVGAGLGWSPLRPLEVVLDLGFTRSAFAVQGEPLPVTRSTRSDGWLPLPGSGTRDSTGSEATDSVLTSLLSVRFSFL